MKPHFSTPLQSAQRSSKGHTERLVYRQLREASALMSESDLLATEIPIALQYNGISHAVLLATPCDLIDLAYGFSFTEGIIRSASDIYDVKIQTDDQGILLDIEIASACLHQLKTRRRQLAGRTGCGLCGLESLNEVRRELPPVVPPAHPFEASAIFHALDQLKSQQPLHQITGATHAAGWADLNGNLQWIREDVGRHNALDKLIGHLLRSNTMHNEGMTVISSRASFEMVQKTAAFSCSVLIAVSAPTSYAVKVAEELGIMLVAFGRERKFSAYSHPHLLTTSQ